LGRVYADKDVQERIIRRSRLDWTTVRPTILTNGPKTRSYRVLVDPRDSTSGFISRADVADFLVKQIDDTSLLRQTPALTGCHRLAHPVIRCQPPRSSPGAAAVPCSWPDISACRRTSRTSPGAGMTAPRCHPDSSKRRSAPCLGMRR